MTNFRILENFTTTDRQILKCFFPWLIEKFCYFFHGRLMNFMVSSCDQLIKFMIYFPCNWLINFVTFSRDGLANFADFFLDQLTNFAVFLFETDSLISWFYHDLNFESINTCSIKENIRGWGFCCNFMKDIIKQFHSEMDIDDAITEYILLMQNVKNKRKFNIDKLSANF